jgi:essential nuclear protein 1
MPKITKIRSAALSAQATRHAPLGQTILEDEQRDKFAVVRQRRDKSHRKSNGKGEEEELDEKATRKILQLSREQQLEVEADDVREQRRQRNKKSAEDDEEEDGDEESVLLDEDDDNYVTHDNGYVTVTEGALSPEDEAIVNEMMGGGERKQTLADLIMAKIEEKEAEQRGDGDEEEEDLGMELPPKVVEVYTDIGKILGRYTSGKLPKAFKVIPSLSNWEEVLYLTRPDMWTAQAMFAATRIFASNLNPKMAQRFYNLVLLDAVRADIVMNKKLNYHYYMALKKSVYKPAAFFKGILLPLCKENCTLREAAIIASVLQRVSIPVHHAAVALHKLAQLEYSGSASIFIQTLLNKKYSLPAPVIFGLVKHFTDFLGDDRTLPVLWHQALLVFLQRYKNEIKNKDELRKVMKKHFHPKITPECRRELFGALAFKEERMELS